jgi:proteasome accessory factor C
LRIFNENDQNYLQAYCYIAKGLRIFRIDRILRSTVLERLESLESLETTKESTESGIGQISTNEKNWDRQFSYAIKVSLPTRDIAERFGIQNHLFDKGSKSQEVIELESFSKAWVERAVLATGADVELIEPADLRKEIYNHAKSVLERYNAQ